MQRRQQVQQGGRVHRLDQVTIEPRCLGAVSVRLSAPAGQRDQDYALALWLD